ncbi:hypothetical protein KUF54_12640 [Comamonas sp. Y33R10-2]|uniref:hypothetical protein n=1 Tax=Comamonas sp. Y33R10-2 TaxID=2853257 RepID=UPI001C5CC288|nr:hypothetical protein [Comamonas sp. Y33R10-2]QXZ08896.1 hypothetical protein KUF54_12640 [Comamonas sp. Y33R10-2]
MEASSNNSRTSLKQDFLWINCLLMPPLYENILIGLGTGLASGLVTGLYSGLIISRRNRFDSLRVDLLRHINSIEYMQEEDGVRVVPGTSSQLIYVASDFAHFGHRQAAEVSSYGHKTVISAINDSTCGRLNTASLELELNKVREKFRAIKPSASLYFPWGQI